MADVSTISRNLTGGGPAARLQAEESSGLGPRRGLAEQAADARTIPAVATGAGAGAAVRGDRPSFPRLSTGFVAQFIAQQGQGGGGGSGPIGGGSFGGGTVSSGQAARAYARVQGYTPATQVTKGS